MTVLRYTLSDEDQRRYGGPETVDLDMDAVGELPAGQLEKIERDLGLPLGEVIGAVNGSGSMRGIRAAVWLARRQFGLKEPFAGFDIHTLKVGLEILPDEAAQHGEVPADADPLGSSSGGSTTSG